ncbi:hypothetical protein TWF718_006416 [Orbilia javanica]|uniref:Uncharacterized protein n=1 Tax=Orbilia javanica TaxID=47235 RepID=A0AAN8RPQ2_9PEZI
MLVLHFLLVLIFSSGLVLGAPAGGAIGETKNLYVLSKLPPGIWPDDRWRAFIDHLQKIAKPRKPRSAVTAELAHTRRPAPTLIPAPVDPPSSAPFVERAEKMRAMETLADCEKRGIDIFGDIPGDAQRVPLNDPSAPVKRYDGIDFENMTFIHTFSADSDASLWATAQVLVSQFPELVNRTEAYQKALKKRETVRSDPGVKVTVHRATGAPVGFDDDRIGIGMWEGGKNDWSTNPQPCQGKGWWIDSVRHGTTYLANIPTYSVGVSFRALGGYDRERLDFRTHSGSVSDCQTILYSAGERTPASCWRHGKVAAKCFILLQNPGFKAPAQQCKNGVCSK